MPFDLTSTGAGLSRRDLLRTTAAVGVAALAGTAAAPLPALAAQDAKAQNFLSLSEFLTGHKLDPVLGARYLAALEKRNPDLMSHVAAIRQIITTAGAADMDAFLALPGTDKTLMATGTKIISAWYLGVVGEPEDAELIAYADALMYRPTQGILAIPTYGPGPDAWGPKPDAKS
ncbi:hypothetical protein GCM10007301_16160 [Azorhizobium oxalatiphilum]|uniref:Membrane bound FAD containing D-sorbitol dehydrogenase n=1 Tax=Azorhizobium oxalatiphilum TaxID=980631 RepID=A0A917BUF9_9HYPH|nr:sugar dehydrogenase complex small subunit [Azorhizobium oxalatiphilum]GGF57215.1 hypothetical protein GCM10007301_16160 [Azorhizobium oxalatiphilum]